MPKGESEKIAMHIKKVNDFIVNISGLTITIGVSFIIAIILIYILSKEPGKTIYYFFIGPFTNRYYFGNMVNAAIPLIFTGLGISLAFKSSVFNLGGEGQVYSGALIATIVCLALPNTNGYFGAFLALVSAMLVGALLAGLSGLFKMKWDTNELISSFLISNAVILIVNYFITGPLDDPNSYLLTTSTIPSQYHFLKILPPSNLNIGIILAILTVFFTYFLMYHSHWGYEMKMCGLNREFSRYGGINVSNYFVLPMFLSGALHGFAGGVSILGTYHTCIKEFSFGMGWNGIAVALIARNNPIGVLPAAIFFAYLNAGAKTAMLHSDVTFEIAAIIQSAVFYLVTAKAIYDIIRHKIERDKML